MNGQSNMETDTLPYVEEIASGNFLYDSGSSNLCSVTTQSGWDGVGGRGYTIGRGCIYTYGRFMSMYGRNQHNIIKQLSSK